MQIPILMYHAIDNDSSVLSVSPQLFEWQLRWISEQGYRVLPLNDVIEKIKSGTRVFPERSVVITFDDGFESVYQNALPSLTKYGFSATIFLVAGHVGKVNNWADQPASIPQLTLANWSQIREMDRYGIEFGSHTINHPRLDQISLEEARVEICQSKSIIEQNLGHAIDFFAFPYGKFNPDVLLEVANTYTGACGTELGLVDLHSDPFQLERIEMFYLKNRFIFRKITKPVMNPYLSSRRWLRRIASTVLRRQW